MARALATFFALGFLSLVFTGIGLGLSFRVTPETRRPHWKRWIVAWSLKGLAVPALIWFLMNIGLSWRLQPFMQEVQAAKNSTDPWLPAFGAAFSTGVCILSSYWAALTIGWALFLAFKRLEGEERADFRSLCLTALLGMMLPAAGIFYLGGWPTAGFATSAILLPIAGYAPSIIKPKRMPPMYTRAIARMRFGKYTEAEMEIIQQLEKCHDDFEGWFLLAELYANQFNDLVEAEQTILEVCDQPRTSPSQLAVALHKLADWHLKIGEDPEAAGRALEMISHRLPGSHLAHMAQLRLKQLPRNSHELRELKAAHPIPMPALGDQIDEPLPIEHTMDRHKAAEMANECVERLQQDPNNVAVREKLARILTERLNKPELGIEQLTLLLNMPEQTEAKHADWLGTIGAWHIRYRQDPSTGRRVLERVIQEFPQSPQAIAARRRIRLLEEEQAAQSG